MCDTLLLCAGCYRVRQLNWASFKNKRLNLMENVLMSEVNVK